MNTKQNHKPHSGDQKNMLMRAASVGLLTFSMAVLPASANSDTSLLSQPQSISVAQTIISNEQSAQTTQYGNTLSEQQISKLEQQRLLQAKGLDGNEAQPAKLTREQVMQLHIDKALKTKQIAEKNNANVQFANGVYRDFYIYDAYSRLFVDNDYDGFYQTFSVTFDADVEGSYANERADVFAELYLSRNGGPWEHYYTTDIFRIYGNVTDDDFEVLTTLDFGYRTDHYDVLIDLYEVGYGDIVATVSSHDLDSLYALPLESSDRDDIDDDYHAGSLSLPLMTMLLLLLGLKLNRVRKISR